MAGRRHHFIPQFLQRGFASHTNGSETYVWVYRTESAKQFNTNIKNIGIETNFYSEDSDLLDESITNLEAELSSFISQLRNSRVGDSIDNDLASKLISHFEVRTRNFRKNFINAGNYLFREVAHFLSDSWKCEKFVANQVKTQAESVLKEMLREKGIPVTLYPIYQTSLYPAMVAKIPEMTTNMQIMLAYINDNLNEQLTKASKTGHIKALTKSHAPLIKVDRYKALNFRLIHTDKISIPLGDSVVVFHVNGLREFKPFLEASDDLLAVILPISSNQILLGAVDGYSPNIELLNYGIVSCSLEFFIASESTTELESLRNYISQNSYFLSDSDVESILAGLIANK